MQKKLGIFGTRGLPAKYGAFDEFVNGFVDYENQKNLNNIHFFIDANIKFKSKNTKIENVTQIFLFGQSSFFRIINYLISFIIMYAKGVRVFLFFGYGASIFFPIFKFFNCKIICNPDGIEWRRPNNFIKKKYFKLCEKIFGNIDCSKIFDSEVINRYYRRHYRAKGETIYYPSSFKDLKDIKNRNNKIQRFYVLGRLLKENNIDLIVDAFSELSPNYKLFIIGFESDYFKQNIKKKILNSQNIFFIGSIYDRARLSKYLSFFDYYIHGHSVGGTNPTLIEALSLKKKIVAFKTSFNFEILGRNGIYFEDKQSLKKIISSDILKNYKMPDFKKVFEKDYIYNKYLEIIFT